MDMVGFLDHCRHKYGKIFKVCAWVHPRAACLLLQDTVLAQPTGNTGPTVEVHCLYCWASWMCEESYMCLNPL